MITLRPAEQRGLTKTSWLTSYHSFSFADYVAAEHQGFKALRVINQDVIQPGQGFGMHAHRDMEILTYVLAGELAHRDSLGNHGLIRAGEMQRMSGGTGILHSEFNNSQHQTVELLQIWLFPAQKGLTPSYSQKAFTSTVNQLQLLVSPDGEQNSLTIQQDVKLWRGQLAEKSKLNYASRRYTWLQLISGNLQLNKLQLKPGDGAAIAQAQELEIQALSACEFLLFDLA